MINNVRNPPSTLREAARVLEVAKDSPDPTEQARLLLEVRDTLRSIADAIDDRLDPRNAADMAASRARRRL